MQIQSKVDCKVSEAGAILSLLANPREVGGQRGVRLVLHLDTWILGGRTLQLWDSSSHGAQWRRVGCGPVER
jgi:hypothetical protein